MAIVELHWLRRPGYDGALWIMLSFSAGYDGDQGTNIALRGSEQSQLSNSAGSLGCVIVVLGGSFEPDFVERLGFNTKGSNKCIANSSR